MRKIREVLRLREDCRLSHRQIARSCSISSATVSDYLMRSKAAGLPWPLPENLTDIDLERMLFPQKPPAGGRPLPDFPEIYKRLKKKGGTLREEWESYKQRHSDGYQFSQFCELYRRREKVIDVVMRQEHRAGEKLFSDFAGRKLHVVVDRTTGETKPAHIFVCTLGASGYTYAEAFWDETTESWCLGHSHAFENHYFGAPEIIVPDNPRSVVNKPCQYEPDLHPDFQHMASHFGAAVIPARVRRPRDKAVVEAAVKLATRWIIQVLDRQKFFSLAELNLAIHELLERLNNKQFKKLPESRLSLFETLEKPILKRLSANKYEYVQIGYVPVSSLDYHVRIEDHFYSVPFTLVKKRIEYRIKQNTVEFLHNGVRVASHSRAITKYGYTTLKAHMPPSHQAYLEWTPARVVDYASRIGPKTLQMVEGIIADREVPQQAFRSCLGIIRLARTSGKERLESACERALSVNSLSFRSVKLILKNSIDQHPLPDAPAELKVIEHENIRGAEYYKEEESNDSRHTGEHETPETQGNGAGAGGTAQHA